MAEKPRRRKARENETEAGQKDLTFCNVLTDQGVPTRVVVLA